MKKDVFDNCAQEYNNYLSDIINSKRNFFLYYGTSKLYLDTIKQIEPTHSLTDKSTVPNIFEFGIGFYLAEYCSTAIGYALQDKIEMLNVENDDEIKEHLSDEHKGCNIHIYELSIDNDNFKIDICLSLKDYKDELTKTINGYKEDAFYHKENDITIGPLCGEYWDEFFKEKNINSLNMEDISSFIDKCIDSIELIPDDDNNTNYVLPIQYCLHQNRMSIIKHEVIEFSPNELLCHDKVLLKLKKIITESEGGKACNE